MKLFFVMERFSFFIVIAIFVLNGCATNQHTSPNDETFHPAPSRARVYVDGQYTGIAPLELKLESKRDYTIEFQKVGFKNKVVVLKNLSGESRIVIDVVGLVPVYSVLMGGLPKGPNLDNGLNVENFPHNEIK